MRWIYGLTFLLLCAAGFCAGLRVAAFNVRVFGPTKFSMPEVVATLSQIVQRYDIVLIQEIRDISETVIPSFVETVNSNRDDSQKYDVVVSIRLGRTSNKEQYAFVYRTDVVDIVDSLQFADTEDVFEREPFSVLVRHKETGRAVPDFFLVGVHIRPSDAFAEIDTLLEVYENAAGVYGIENGIILGDFNADCSYLSMSKFRTLSLVVDERFTWLLDVTDTTTGNSSCAYDRIVSAGRIIEHMVPDSAQVFRFDQEYGLTQSQALDVSDHYPVEVEFQGSGSVSVSRQPVLLCAVVATLLLLAL